MVERPPVFGRLTRVETEALLRRNNVGRLAFVRRGVVTIEPIHYVMRGGWIYCRTSHGLKIDAITGNPWVAFEVDEIDGTFDWRSAVVKGTIYILDGGGSQRQKTAWSRGVTALRTLIPETLLEGDPAPFREIVLGIFIHESTGRKASTAASVRRKTARVRR